MTDFSKARPTKYRDVEIRAARGNKLTAKSWLTEAPLRMLMNNLDPQVAENPKELVVYGGIGRAARNWECYDQIVESLTNLNDDETLLVQSGKPVGVPIQTWAPGLAWAISCSARRRAPVPPGVCIHASRPAAAASSPGKVAS